MALKTYPATVEFMVRMLLTGNSHDKRGVYSCLESEAPISRWAKVAVKWAKIIQECEAMSYQFTEALCS